MKKRIFSLILCAALLLSVVPVLGTPVKAAAAISKITVTDVTEPVSGEKPVFVAAADVKDEHSYAYLVQWTDHTGTSLSESSVFSEGQEYTCHVLLIPDDGYEYAAPSGITATMNGKAASVSLTTVREDAVVVSYTFKAAKAISSLTVTGVTLPCTSEAPSMAATVSSDGATIASFKWYDVSTRTYLTEADLFEGGKSYTCYVTAEPKDGYGFPSTNLTNGSINNITVPVIGTADSPNQRELSYTFVADTTVYSVKLSDLTAPVMGSTPDFTMKTHTNDYTVKDIQWWDENNQVLMDKDDTFENGLTYSCTIYLMPAAERSFAAASAMNATVNGEKADVRDVYGEKTMRCVNYTFIASEAVTKVEVTRVVEPVTGNVPSKSVSTESDAYLITDMEWYDVTEQKELAEADTFQGGHTYECRIYVEAKGEHSLAAYTVMTATINGKTASVKPVYNHANTRLISCTFTAKGLEMKTQPKDAYADEGDTVIFTSAANAADVHYQWYAQKGENLPEKVGSDSATLIFTKISASRNGSSVWCVITRGDETVTSSKAFLTVSEKYNCPFTDVPTGEWYYANVSGAHKMGLIDGKTDTTFCPNDNITYAEIIKLAACMHQLYTTGTVTLTNGSSVWYSTYMKYCLDNEILAEDLSSKANVKITRSEYVAIFARALPAEAFDRINTIPANAIPDVKISDDNSAEIYKFYRAGIIDGSDDYGTFNPNSNIKRSEVATILIRMMDPTTRVGAPSKLGQAKP